MLRHPHGNGKRKRSGAADERCILLSEFKNSPYYLRISASSVSALCGLHPYQNLPNLFFDLVYQSHLGQLLLQEDARALGLTLVDARTHERDTMLALASAVSEETRELVKQVLEVSEGTRKLQSVDEVQAVQDSIKSCTIEAQKVGKLSAKQVESLVELSRGHVSTGFGTCHEDEALDAYESRVGCRVRERNEALMEWRFRRLCDVDGEMGVTALPMGKATRRCWKKMNEKTGNDDRNVVEHEETANDTPEVHIEFDGEEVSGIIGVHKVNNLAVENVGISSSSVLVGEKEKPFFRIIGAVDGIRDELYMVSSMSTSESQVAAFVATAASSNPTNNKGNKDNGDDATNVGCIFADDEEDIWTLRPLIVEIKHRMNEAKMPPPLYDQIQTCLYCYMYDVEDADLVQVVRRKNNHKEKENDTLENEVEEGNAGHGKSKIQSNAEDINITITRVSLYDPVYNHNHHWQATLLPRLASFVDAVYNVRKDDGKRYRLLMTKSENNAEEDPWQLLLGECPWLQHCDTAFTKQRQL